MIKKPSPALVWALIALISAVGVFGFASAAQADFGKWITENFLFPIVNLLGKILVIILEQVIAVAQYNDFIGNPAVTKGWVIVRDICNMFFILVLLLMAFGTILKLQNYTWTRLLGRLIMMAVLINFSKMIAGFFIDIGQVIMMTFVNAFKDAAAGNFVTILGLNDMVNFAQSQKTAPTGGEILGSAIFAIIMLFIAIVVMVVLLLAFLVRIIMLWILVVLSPLAYLLNVIPGRAQSYASQWWQKFGQYVAIGPVLAFFIWLSLAVLTDAPTTEILNGVSVQTTESGGKIFNGTDGSQTLSASVVAAGSSENILRFIISIAMLIGALMAARQMGGVAGNFAGAAMGRIQKAGSGILKSPLTAAKKIGRGGLSIASQSAGVKGMLRSVASGPIPGLRGLATRAYVGLDQRSREEEDKARRYMKHLPPEVIARIANKKVPLSARGVARIRVGRDLMPSSIKDNTKLQQHLASMSRENLQNINDPEWTAIGKRMQAGGMALTGNALSYVQKDMDARGGYNYGVSKANEDKVGRGKLSQGELIKKLVKGTTRYGEELKEDSAGLYGFMPNNPIVGPKPGDKELAERLNREPGTIWEHKYDLATEKEMRENKTGPGTTAVGEFGRGLRDTYLFDFNRLSAGLKEQILKGSGRADVKAIKGVNITDKGVMNKLAGEMTKLLDEDAKKAQGKSLENLRSAQQRLSNPAELEKINAMSLVNSGSVGYEPAQTISRMGEVKLHEEAHTYGVSEEQVPGLAQRVRKEKLASQREQIFKDVAAGATIEDAIQHAIERKASSKPATNKPSDIIDKEKGAPAKEELKLGEEALIDKSLEKYEATKAKVKDYEKMGGASAFYISQEYKSNPEKYFNQEDYEVSKELESEREKAAEAGGVATFASRQSNTLGINANTFAGGKYKDQAGLYITDRDTKEQVAQEYANQLQKEIADLTESGEQPERLNSLVEARARLVEAVHNPEELKNINFVNQARIGYTARHVVAHEENHQKLDALYSDEDLQKLFKGSYSEEEGDKALDQVRQKMGRKTQAEAKRLGEETMSDEEAIRELFAEGMANALGSHADKGADAIKLKPELIQKVKEAGQAKDINFMTEIPDEVASVDKAPSVLASKVQARYAQMSKKAQDFVTRIKESAKAAAAPITKVVKGAREKIGETLENREINKLEKQSSAYNTEAEKATGDARSLTEKLNQAKSNSQKAQQEYRQTWNRNSKTNEDIENQAKGLDKQRREAINAGDVGKAGEIAKDIGNKRKAQGENKREIENKKAAAQKTQLDQAGAERSAALAVNVADNLRKKAGQKEDEKSIKILEAKLKKSPNNADQEVLDSLKDKLAKETKAGEVAVEVKPILPKDIPKVQAEMVAQSKAAAIEIDEVTAEVKGKPEVREVVSKSEALAEDIDKIPLEKEVSSEEFNRVVDSMTQQLDNLTNALKGTSETLSKHFADKVVKPMQQNLASIKQTDLFGNKMEKQNFLRIFKETLQGMGKMFGEKKESAAAEAAGRVGKAKKSVEQEEIKT